MMSETEVRDKCTELGDLSRTIWEGLPGLLPEGWVIAQGAGPVVGNMWFELRHAGADALVDVNIRISDTDLSI
jgi:hypothetical protein